MEIKDVFDLVVALKENKRVCYSSRLSLAVVMFKCVVAAMNIEAIQLKSPNPDCDCDCVDDNECCWSCL